MQGKLWVTRPPETEWTELVRCGWNRLWTEPEYRPRVEVQEYGDGRSPPSAFWTKSPEETEALRRYLDCPELDVADRV